MRNIPALGILALLVAILTGGLGQALGTQDVRADVGQLGAPCTYWTPIGSDSGETIEHRGHRSEITIIDPDAVSNTWGCTDQIDMTNCLEHSCFLSGEHYFMFQANQPFNGCIQFNIAGLRKGVWYGSVNGTPIPPAYSSPYNEAVEKVCNLEYDDVVEMVWMACPDITGPSGPDNKIDLMNDIFEVGFAYGTTKGDPDWNLLTDSNEDGIVDLMNDIFSVIYRWNLDCDDFPIM